MKLLRDPLGRPIKRLYFKTEELDERCERIVAEFMDHRSGGFRLPIPTDDIIRMIEAEADDRGESFRLPILVSEWQQGCLLPAETAVRSRWNQMPRPPSASITQVGSLEGCHR